MAPEGRVKRIRPPPSAVSPPCEPRVPKPESQTDTKSAAGMYGLRSINNMYSEHAGQRWGLSVQRLDRGMNQPKTTAEPHAVAYAGWKPFPSIAVGSDFIIVGHPEFQQGKAQTPGQSQEISAGA